jgi:signal transduction histidine kinase
VQRARYVGGIALLAALYYGAAHFGYAFNFSGPIAAIVWLPVGVGIAFLYLAGVQFWPGVVIGDLLVNDYSRLPFGSALGQTFGNLLEVLVATLLLQAFARRRSLNGDARGVWGILVAIATGTAISATVGSVSLWAGGAVGTDSLARVWRTWWLGDFSGALLVVPLALAWFRPPDSALSRWRVGEAALVLGAVAACSELAWNTSQPLTYIVFPLLILTAFRLGPRGATLAVLIAAGFAVWATTHFTGPFDTHSLSRSVLETQLFIAVASVSTQCLAAVVCERERFARRLWESRARLVKAADTERRRLERNLHDGAQQRLSALLVRLNLSAQGDGPPSGAILEAARVELAATIDELRRLAHGKQPALLTERGLAAAVLDLANRSGVPTEVVAVPERRLPRTAEATAYYVIAEAVANAQKHARPTAIQVLATSSDDVLRVEVRDDGVGGAVGSPESGIEGLRDRVEALGGKFDIYSPIGRGTTVAARIPATASSSNP